MERMKTCLGILFFLIGSSALNVNAENSATKSPIGYWKAVDKITGKTKSIIQIWQTEDNTLKGKIIKIFPSSAGKYNQSLGAVILSGLMVNENQWNGGNIVDLENGKTYQCSIQLAENGKKLDVKGYTGISLLHHSSQTWERVDLMSDSETKF